MFNLKKQKNAQLVREKDLRQNNVGPKADEGQSIAEKELPDRKGELDTTTEDHLNVGKSDKQAQVIEKVINENEKHRTATDGLDVPSINTVVAKMEADRLSEYETNQVPHWSLENDDKQTAGLPKWDKNAPQHDKVVLNNDRRRFEGKDVKPLVGGITVADIQNAAVKLGEGGAKDYNAAITAILKEADAEERELTAVERKAVVDLKIARTRELLRK